jgi:hypothetical protein
MIEIFAGNNAATLKSMHQLLPPTMLTTKTPNDQAHYRFALGDRNWTPMESGRDCVKIVLSQHFFSSPIGLCALIFNERRDSEKLATALRLVASTAAQAAGTASTTTTTTATSSSSSSSAVTTAAKFAPVATPIEFKIPSIPTATASETKTAITSSTSSTSSKQGSTTAASAASSTTAAAAATTSSSTTASTTRVTRRNSGSAKEPASSVLSGVRACFSGLVDPERAEVRKILVDLGGQYSQNWDDKCTHLVASFVAKSDKQTSAVEANAPVVRASWLRACQSGVFVASIIMCFSHHELTIVLQPRVAST